MPPSRSASTSSEPLRAFTAAARELLDRVPNPRVEKPFEPGAFRELVARLLAGAAPAP